MGIKEVIVHRSVIAEWLTRKEPPIPSSRIQQVIQRIDDVICRSSPEDVIIVEESPNTGFSSLPEQVGQDNSVRLYGVRAGYCLKIARNVLEGAGITVTLDNEGTLP